MYICVWIKLNLCMEIVGVGLRIDSHILGIFPNKQDHLFKFLIKSRGNLPLLSGSLHAPADIF